MGSFSTPNNDVIPSKFTVLWWHHKNALVLWRLRIQNGGPKFANFLYFCEISQFCSELRTKYNFVISMSTWLKKKFWVSVSTSGLRNLLPLETKTSISLDQRNHFLLNFIFKVIKVHSNVLLKKMILMTPKEGKLTILRVTQKQA